MRERGREEDRGRESELDGSEAVELTRYLIPNSNAQTQKVSFFIETKIHPFSSFYFEAQLLIFDS